MDTSKAREAAKKLERGVRLTWREVNSTLSGSQRRYAIITLVAVFFSGWFVGGLF